MLSDPNKREIYDRAGEEGLKNGGFGGGGGMGGHFRSPEELFAEVRAVSCSQAAGGCCLMFRGSRCFCFVYTQLGDAVLCSQGTGPGRQASMQAGRQAGWLPGRLAN